MRGRRERRSSETFSARISPASTASETPRRFASAFNVSSTSDNSSAGVLVPSEFGQDVVFNRESFGILRRLAEVLPMSSDTPSNSMCTTN